MTYTTSASTGNPGRTRKSPGLAIADSAAWALALLLVVGSVTDVQGVALLPLLGKMTAALNLTPSEVTWAVNSTSIAAAVLTGITARFADVVGHKKVLLPLLALGVVGSVLCALASSFEMLLAGRVILGAAISAPMCWAILRIRTTPRKLEQAALWNGTVIAVMTPIGLVTGGLLLQAGASWSSFFWIIGGGYFVMLVLAACMPETPREMRVKARLDTVGALGLGVWVVLLLLPLSNGSSWGWSSGRVIGLFAAGAGVLVLWVFQQRATRKPMMDFRDTDTRQVVAGYSIYAIVSLTATSLYILLPALAQTPVLAGYGLGLTVLRSSMLLLPILPGAMIAAAVSKTLLAKYGPRPPIVLGGALVCVSFVLMAFAHSEQWYLYVFVLIYGTGITMAFNVGWALTASAGRQDNMSTTFGIQYALAIPTSAVIIAIVNTVLSSDTAPVAALGGFSLPKESAYSTLLLVVAGLALVFYVLNGLTLVPRRLGHQVTSPSVVAATGTVDLTGAGVAPGVLETDVLEEATAAPQVAAPADPSEY